MSQKNLTKAGLSEDKPEKQSQKMSICRTARYLLPVMIVLGLIGVITWSYYLQRICIDQKLTKRVGELAHGMGVALGN